jgi:pyruvate,water dikinase
MVTQFFKRSLLVRVIAFIVIANFIFTGIPLSGYSSSAIASDSLRPQAASNTATGDDIGRDLKNPGTGADSNNTDDLSERLIVEFSEIGKEDVPIAGGKGANLGELQKVRGISVPLGVAITTKAFQLHIDRGTVEIEEKGEKTTLTLRQFIEDRLRGLDYNNSEELALAGEDIRKAIASANMPKEVETEIRQWYQRLCDKAGIKDLAVAVRSSATAEDLPDASFAGQQDTYLNMRGADVVLDAVKRNWASLFTDRAIFYRHEQKIDHSTAYISVILQQMVESQVAGTAFSVHTDTGFPSIAIDAAWGLGEGIVSGAANPDSYILAEDSSGRLRIYRRDFGKKRNKVVYKKELALAAKEGTELVETSYAEQHKFSLTDRQVIQVARAVEAIHNYYGDYMDIEWGIDAKGKLWILQARAETIWRKWKQENPHTVRMENMVVPEELTQSATVLLSGISGSRAAKGKVIIVDATKEGTELAKGLNRVKPGDILVTTMTRPDMVPAMKRAGAIVTDEGGPTCHAAIVARELGIPCIVGTSKATKVLTEGIEITVDANRGKVYAGTLKIVELRDNVHIPDLPVTKTKIGVIIASPLLAMRMWGFSEYSANYGVGLLRKEFADTTEILVHPLAGLAYDMYKDPNLDEEQRRWIKENIMDDEELRQAIEDTIEGYPSFEEFFKDKLANTIALIAGSVARGEGQRVKFRTTDFKTNEYRNQIGGPKFEPDERNPMMGYRGINRMLSEAYRRAFELEIEAIKKARQLQKNIDVMFPVVRTPEELKDAVGLFAKHGLVRGKDGFQIGMMVEVPSNIFQAAEFYPYVDFMSIGSNDMTQFTLGLGRDNEKMKTVFDEANPAVKRGLEIVIKQARLSGVTSGLCGQRPSSDPKFAAFLVGAGIDSISVVGEVYKNVVSVVAQQEKKLEGQKFDPTVAGWGVPKKDGNPQRIISSFVDANGIITTGDIHPQILLRYERGEITDENLKIELARRLGGKTAHDYVMDRVYSAMMQRIQATPKDIPVIYTTDDLDKIEYESLMGGQEYEPFDENPQLGFNGLARVTDPEYQEFFRWQLEGIKKAREDSGRKNIGIRLNLVRTLDEVKTAMEIIKKEGLVPGEDGFMVGMEIAIPSNVLLINEFIGLGINFLVENNERFLYYDLAMDPGNPYVNISDRSKENALKIPRRVLTNAAERNKIPIVQDANGFIQTVDTRVYRELSGGYDNVVKALTNLADSKGALVIGANTILENAGTIAALRKIREAETGLKIAVWAQDEAIVNQLKAMGVGGVADIMSSQGLNGVLAQLADIEKDRIALINSPGDLENIDILKLQEQGFKLINVKTPNTKEASLNTMPLVIARAIAGIFQDQESVVKPPYQELIKSYSESGQISFEDLVQLSDLTSQISTVPLVRVSEEIAQAQTVYEATRDQI